MPYPAKLEIEVLPVDELSEEFGLPRLGEYLRTATYELFEQDGRRWVAVADWNRFVRASVEGAWELPGESDENRLQFDMGGQAQEEPVTSWNWRRAGLISRNPWLGRLADDFIRYVLANEPEARAQPHGQTVTFVMPPARRAGLRLRVGRGRESGGLWLVAQRRGQPIETWVRSEADFQDALQWLRNLPNY